MTVTTTDVLLGVVQTLLTGTTAAGTNVYLPGDWPSWDGRYPYIRVRPLREHKESQGNAGINFEVVATIRITARVSAPAQAADAGADNAETALWVLGRQIETTVINAQSLKVLISEFPFVDTEVEVNADGREHYAELVMDIGLAFYQGAEAFAPQTTVPLTEMTVDTDLVDVFDPSGTYSDPAFPVSVLPAPRTSGPDGRPEGAGLDIQLPQ